MQRNVYLKLKWVNGEMKKRKKKKMIGSIHRVVPGSC